MTKTNYTINSYADLNREELRVRKRLKKQEELIKLQLKTLPEEVVTAGISRLINGVLSGNLFQQAGTVVSLVKSLFRKKTDDAREAESQGVGIMDILKTVLKNQFSK